MCQEENAFWQPRSVEEIRDALPEMAEEILRCVTRLPKDLRAMVDITPARVQELQDRLTDIVECGEPHIYLAGPMRLGRIIDREWRSRYGAQLEAMGYCVVNTVVIETAMFGVDFLTFQEMQQQLIMRGYYRTFAHIFGPVKEFDMALVHLLARHEKSAIVAHYPTAVVKSGTDIECFEAYRLGVPVFIHLDGAREEVRPFLNEAWAELYRQRKFHAFHSWKRLMAYMAVWRQA